MSRPIAILLIVQALVAYFLLAPVCVLRREHVTAFRVWRDNPTVETKAQLDRQKRITALYSFGFYLVAFGAMAGVTMLGARIWTSKRKIRS